MSTSQLIPSVLPLAQPIHHLRLLSEILSWTSSSAYNSWLALAGWWIICAFAPFAFKYLLPLCLLLHVDTAKQTLYTEYTVDTVIADLSVIRSSIPSVTLTTVPLRALVLIYPVYLLLTHTLPLNLLLALFGTLLITYRSPWSYYLCSSLSRSAYLRTLFHHFRQAYFVGRTDFFPASSSIHQMPPVAVSFDFLFTIYENQRWWVGLDWTAALLPAERPSWCSYNFQPLSPPSTFTLPEPTIVYVPSRSKSGKQGRIKKMARWRWDETEWRVAVRRESNLPLTRVERPLPTDSGTGELPSPSSSISLTKLRESISASPVSQKDAVKREIDDTTAGDHADCSSSATSLRHHLTESEEPLTDSDGWIYGDNKWENTGPKGGLGKYTRYRRWTRIAVVEETAEEEEDTLLISARQFPFNTPITVSSTVPTLTSPRIQGPAISPTNESPDLACEAFIPSQSSQELGVDSMPTDSKDKAPQDNHEDNVTSALRDLSHLRDSSLHRRLRSALQKGSVRHS